MITKPAEVAIATKLYVGRIFSLKQIKQFMGLIDRPHRFYRIIPTSIVLFDAVNYPDEPRQELIIRR